MTTILDFRPPHPSEEHVFSVLVGEAHYLWALHSDEYFPTVCWRTAPIQKEETEILTPCDVLCRYLPEEALVLVFGTDQKGRRTQEQAARHRAALRIPAISVYVLLSNDHANETAERPKYDEEETPAMEYLRLAFQDVPCNFYQLKVQDFLPAVSNTSTSRTTRQHHSKKASTSKPALTGGLEQIAMLKAASDMLPDRRFLLVDSGFDATRLFSIEPKYSATNNSTNTIGGTAAAASTGADSDDESADQRKPAAIPRKSVRDSSPWTHFRVTSLASTASLTSRFRALHERTGALPAIDAKMVLTNYLTTAATTPAAAGGQQQQQQPLHSSNLPLMATNTVDAMVGCVVQETMLQLRHTVKSWVLTNAVSDQDTSKSSNNTNNALLLLVCFTGMEADVLSKLLLPGEQGYSPTPEWDLNDDDVSMKLFQCDEGPLKDFIIVDVCRKTDGKVVMVEVRHLRHLVHQGVHRLLLESIQQRQAEMNPVEALRLEVMGCRIAKTFLVDSSYRIYRGRVMAVYPSSQPPATTEASLDSDLFLVRYDDGDEEEFLVAQVYEHLLFYVEKGEAWVHDEAEQAAFETKEKESQQAAEKLAETSLEVQNFIRQRRASDNQRLPQPGQTSKKRIFSETGCTSESSITSEVMADKEVKIASYAADEAIVDSSDNCNVLDLDDAVLDPKSLLRCKVAKYFSAVLYCGEVIDYFPPEGNIPAMWRVEYSDGDLEDYRLNELRKLIALYQRRKGRELNGKTVA